MNTYQKEEKFLKASLKKRISFNLQTLIKFLITGVVAVSVTACGGGGGGGSSASTPSNPIDKNTGNITESVTAEDKTYINEGSIEVKNRGESSYALAGKNSKIVNENRISITEGDKNTFGKIVGSVSGIDELDNLLNQGYNVGVFAQGGNVVNGEKGQINVESKKGIGIYLSGAKLENNGNINMKGKFQVNEQGIIGSENIGVWANNGSEAINNGEITLNTIIDDTVYKGNYPLELPYSIGMLAENGSNTENKNSINGTGNLIGMSVTSNSLGVNNGDINLSSGKINSDVTFEEGEYYKYNYDEFFYTDVIGMKAVGEGSKVVNNKNIKINGKGTGMVANDGATGINNGNISMTSGEIHKKGYSESSSGNGYDNYELVKSWAEVIGMSADNGDIENGLNGTISIDGNGKGMYGINNSNLVNNGTITVNGKFEYATPTFTDGEEIPSNYEWGSSLNAIGMEIVNGGKAENSGNIIMNADLSVGILAKDGEVINNNLIEINSKNDNILGSKRSYSSAIEVENGKGTNNGIVIGKGNNIVGLDGYNSEILNENKIELTGSGLTGIYTHQGGSGINNGDITINVTENSDVVSSGISLEGAGKVENNGTININGKLHVDKEQVTPDIMIGIEANGSNEVINNGKIEMAHTVDLVDQYDGLEPEYDTAVGMYATNGAKATNNNEIIGKGAITGMYGDNGAIITNNGIIAIESIKYAGKYEIEDGVSTKEIPTYIVGMGGTGVNTIVKNEKEISLIGEGVALKVSDGAQGSNVGTINLTSLSQKVETEEGVEEEYNSYLKGLDARRGSTVTNEETGIININGNGVGIKIREDAKGYNYGKINIESKNYASGIETSGNGYAENHGDIVLKNNNSVGIEVKDESSVKNYGNIFALNSSVGIKGVGSLSKASNFGTITAIGEEAIGMAAYNGSTVINEKDGTINVGTGALGMEASDNGSKVVNYGIINIAADAEGGMRAWNGGTVANHGTIIIDANHQTSDNTIGMSKEQVAIYASDDAYLENTGEIITNGDVSIEVGGTYTVGTNSDGTFGKLTASDVDLNGNLVISTDMVAGTYEESYKLDNIIEGENINLGEEYKNLSNSLLYDAKTSKDEEGNLDGELVRNDNSISDFTSDNLTQVGELFDKYLAKENYETLSQEDKKLVDKIFASTSSANEIKNAMNNLVGPEHLNISRQIFDIKDSFRKYDTSVISTLDKYNHNFILIGEYGDIQSKDEVVGYDTKMTGFNGAMRLADNLYGTLGYGYSDIEYDNNSESKIQTIHGAIYKDYGYNKSNIRVGVFGEYNFHETDREDLDGYVNTDYNSYLVGVTGEISKKYGDNLYIQPRLALDAVYGNVENFSEKSLEIKEQDYTSILPKAELIVGKKLNNIGLFAKSSYSYELGNLDKDMDIKLLNNTVGIDNDTMDKGNLDLSIGTEFNFESLSLNVELGKEFGKRDREYIKAGIIYKF